LQTAGFKTAVLRVQVEASCREDWILEQEDRGIEVLITRPDLVRTGLDLLSWSTVVFLQSVYSVYTVQQAARRSCRIGQKEPADVYFLGYVDTAQIECLRLMAK
jgi:HJR/Mrr/RecB family endonuclease